VKIVATIEARMASSRLPGKILKPILDKPILYRLIERVKRSRFINQIVIATTTDSGDDITEYFCRQNAIGCYRGSNDDVLDRVLGAAKANKADLIVELTGDCPVLDPELIDQVIKHYLDNSFDYVSNILERTYPRGMDAQIFSTKVLEETSKLTQDPADRENVSLYIYEHPERFKLSNVYAKLEHKRPDLRLTVDTKEDFELINGIFKELYPIRSGFSLSDIIQLLDQRPELRALNSMVQQKKVR